jgi:hypothetical protein
MTMARCPHCKQMIQPVSRQARICRVCDTAIDAHMKWRFVRVGKKTMVEHRHCDNPFEYLSKAEMALKRGSQ